ncbi:unnamed protein product [Acanthoscelides obtectus]|uniref:Uncharacterized protein n=1 Tax=Acanthoscelides obtectus TaxID=200917 RepID=A0A9P0K1P4_ACAOB|nr:unnamed protein product [Acanthoscelides obtectus]CAK1663420.1 Neurotrypsin [Acanthoscelides obtectus]
MVYKIRKFPVHIILSLTIIGFSQAIIDPSYQQTKYYTPGIKTKNWKNEHVITHQNYSKVFFHNNISGTILNGHQYGVPNKNKTDNTEETATAIPSQDILQIFKEEQIRPVIHKRRIAKALEVYEKCPPGETGQFVYHLSCNQFLNCWKGRGNVQNCAPGTLFNPKTLECDYPEKVDCVTGPRQNTVGNLRSAKSIAQPSCPEDFTGLIPNYTDCSKFINCNNGQSMSQDCPPGTLFDTNKNLCDFPQNAVCFNGQNEITKPGNQYEATSTNVHTKCDPSTQGCYLVLPNSQYPYYISGYSQKNDEDALSAGRQFTYYGSGYSSEKQGNFQATNCDLSSGNCKRGLGSSSSQSAGQLCNPLTQNCGQITALYGSTASCDPRTQNCGQRGPGDTQTSSYGVNQHGESVLLTGEVACDPLKQNCEQYGKVGRTHGSDVVKTSGHDSNRVTYGENTCDPSVENCGRTTVYTHSTGNVQKSCDPSTQNCQTIRGQHTTPSYGSAGAYGQTADLDQHGQNWCDPRTQNCGTLTGYEQATKTGQHGHYYGQAGQQTQYGYTRQDDRRCDPRTQNCDKNVQYGQVSGRGQQNCNPSMQNCDQYYHHGQVGTPGQDVPSKCDPLTQSCGQQVQYVQALAGGQQNCNPSTQNCGQYYQHGQVETSGQGGQSRCDPRSQNCGQQLQTGHVSGVSKPNCDPRTQNCGQYYHHGQVETSKSGIQSSCDPRKQNCGQQVQDSHISGAGQGKCDPRIQNCGQYYQHGYVGTPEQDGQGRCDPRTQYCGQEAQYGGASGSSRPNCNPRTQNCGQHNQQGQAGTTEAAGQNRYDPYTQNCGQVTFNAQVTGGSQVPCDPLTQNCGQYHQYGQTGAPGQSRCDPGTQNCGQYGYKAVQSLSNKQQGANASPCNPLYQICAPTAGPVQNSLNGGCNPQEKNCSPSGHREPKILHHNSKSNDCIPGQNCEAATNYKKVCNINDHKCRSESHSIVSKDTNSQRPKCPDGFQGITKHPTDCQKFLNCANGQTFIQDCAPGTLFNPKLGNCDFPYNVDCDEAKIDVPIEEDSNDYDGYAEGYTEIYGRVPSSTWQGQYGDNSQYSKAGTTEKTDWQKQYEEHARQYGSNAGHGNIRTSPQESKTREQRVKPIVEINRGKSGVLIRPVTPHTLPSEDQSESISSFSDYVDVFDPKEQKYIGHSTTPRSVSRWPTPIPTTDPDADYIFEYDDGEPITMKPENVIVAEYKKKKVCGKGDFYCSSKMCITKAMVCDGHRDCESGKDEKGCDEFIGRFTLKKNAQLEVLEKQRWINVSYTTCAMQCIQSNTFNCRSFNYRRYDRTCFLSDLNIGLTGALRPYNPIDYYELRTGTIDCSDKSKYFECSNKKCLLRDQLCDGTDDCGDRQDEKNCSPKDFGYSVKLAGAKEENQGRIEVSAFGKTGYICDDQFGLQEANIVCKELGFDMGAIDFKGQSYFARDVKENNTLYMMDDLKCFGNETTLLDCMFAGWGIHDCQDQEIVGVVCKTPQEKCGKGYWKCATTNECVPLTFMCDDLNDCSDDSDEDSQYCEAPTEIRLVNGSSVNEGRLELSHYGIWGTVCDDDFNEDAAKFVCKRLGYKGASTVKKEGYFGSGSGPIWLDQVSCSGDELDLKQCTTWEWGEHNCDHNEDVGVVCDDTEPEVEVQRHAKLPQSGDTTGLANACGLRKDYQFMENDLIQARVVKGATARKGDYPWQAAIRAKSKDKTAHWCGAVIVGRRWVLTAAHCLQGYPKGSYVIAAGDYNVDEDEGTEQLRYIEEYFVHEEFRKGGHKMNNDIALVKLKGHGFEFTDDVQAICLPDTNTEYEMDLNCTISGYGSVKSGVAGEVFEQSKPSTTMALNI